MTRRLGHLGRRQWNILLALVAAALTACTGSASGPIAAKIDHPMEVSPYQINLLADGTEIELAGGMPYGTAEAVRKELDTAPSVHVIHLNSTGGQALEGYKLGLLIKERHLVTYTSTTCASACTLAFIAGTRRYLAENAWLGFHSASLSLGGESWATGNQAMRDIYQRAGLPESFIAKALTTAPSEIWYPTHQELTTAHVVDEIVDAQKFAKSGLAHWNNTADLDHALQANRFYAVLAARDATSYSKIREIFLAGSQSGRSAADVDADATKFAAKYLLPAYIKSAPDAELLRYQRVQLDELEYMAKTAPSTCAATAFPDLGIAANDLEHSLSLSLQGRDIDSLADLADAAITRPRANAGDEILAQIAMLKFFHEFFKTSPASLEIIKNPKAHLDDPQLLCHTVRDFYRAILDQPSEQAAAITRAILGRSS
ncbi:MAG TPA: hypothetical protein VND94_19475 [Terriglobia bacterium]|nr:hypothetical protein [Terriglobia bacterium]